MAGIEGSSASSFYNQLRRGYIHTDNMMAHNVAVQATTDTNAIHNRLRAISAGEKIPTSPTNNREVKQQHNTHTDMSTVKYTNPQLNQLQPNGSHPFNYQTPLVAEVTGQSRPVVMNEVPNLAVNNDTGLSEEEMSAIRVFEFDARVRVSADVRKPHDLEAANIVGNPSKLRLQSLCDDAIAKVFPKHVVFVRSDGSPVVEIVISELFELTEDDLRQSLTFHLQQQKGGIAVIEVVCANSSVRSALYKIIVAKRNFLERFA